jgi:hypothetical protein
VEIDVMGVRVTGEPGGEVMLRDRKGVPFFGVHRDLVPKLIEALQAFVVSPADQPATHRAFSSARCVDCQHTEFWHDGESGRCCHHLNGGAVCPCGGFRG